MSSVYVKFSRQFGIASFASLSVYLRNLLLVPVLTRTLGASEYGAWVQIFALTELLAAIALLGLSHALLRFLPQRRAEGMVADDFFSILAATVATGTALAVLGVFLSDVGAEAFFDSAENGHLLRMALGLVPVSVASSMVLFYFRASRRILLCSTLHLVESLGYVTLAIAFVLSGMETLGVVAALLILRALIAVVGAGLVIRQIGICLPTFACLRPFLAFGLPFVPLGIFTWVTSISDRYVLAYYFDTGTSGVYSVSYGLGNLVGIFFSPLFFILAPALAELWESQQFGALKEHLAYAQKYTLLFALPFTALLTVYSREIIGIWATAEFVAFPGIIACAALGVIAMNLAAVVETTIGLTRKTRIIPAIYLCCALLNLVGNVLVVPHLGTMGAAITTLLAYGLQAVLMYGYVRRVYPFVWNLPFIWRSIAGVGVMVSFLIASRGQDLPLKLTGLLLGVGSYVGTLVLLGGFEAREWGLLKKLLARTDPDVP